MKEAEERQRAKEVMAQALIQKLRAVWRRWVGTPPSWHFTMAHRHADLSGRTIAEEIEIESRRRAEIVRDWERGL